MIRLPPPEIVRDLRDYDPDLRIRWGHRIGKWLIEKKMPHAYMVQMEHMAHTLAKPGEYKGSDLSRDLADGWVEDYVHVLTVPDTLLGGAIFDALAEADAHRQGGMAALNRRYDESLDRWDAATDKVIDDEIHESSREAAELLWHRLGTTIAVPETLDPSPRIEHHDGFRVIERRHRLLASETA